MAGSHEKNGERCGSQGPEVIRLRLGSRLGEGCSRQQQWQLLVHVSTGSPASVTVSVPFTAFLGAGDLQSQSRETAVGEQAAQMWVLFMNGAVRGGPRHLPTCPSGSDAGIRSDLVEDKSRVFIGLLQIPRGCNDSGDIKLGRCLSRV